eukprot:TRINITY_DN7138_c0_g1_i1.p1 TRINITY_DN7138_c0_g1~~TRINITY_DN7138_c0_g1_i1.p1  ORF type:complete len:740 (-),score=84.40 TRINITY_DN7138_c0_g1_i1:12-2231(-)
MLCSFPAKAELDDHEADSYSMLVDSQLRTLRKVLLDSHGRECSQLMQTNCKLMKEIQALRGPEKKLPPKDVERGNHSLTIMRDGGQLHETSFHDLFGSGPRLDPQVDVKQPMQDSALEWQEPDDQVIEMDSVQCSDPWLRFSVMLIKHGRKEVAASETEEHEMRHGWQRSAVMASSPQRKRRSQACRISQRSLTNMGEWVLRNQQQDRWVKMLDASFVSRLVMAPQSFGRLLWMFFGFMSIGWDMIMSPVSMFDMPEVMTAVYNGVGLVSLAYWSIDVILQFLTGVTDGTRTDMRPSVIWKSYGRSWLLPDIAMLTSDVIILSIRDGVEGSFKGVRAFRALRMLRLLRLIKVGTFIEYLTMLRERYMPESLLLAAALIRIWGAFFLVNHYVACGWYALGLSNTQKSWILVADVQDASFYTCYANSLHWSLTQFTPATNNLSPSNPEERIFAIFVIFLATGCFSSFIGAITTAVNQLRANQAQRTAEETCLRRFFSERSLSIFLFMEIQSFCKRKNLYKRYMKEDEVRILRDIPASLKIVLREELHKPLLASVRWLPQDCATTLMGKICMKVFSECYADPSQDIFLPGAKCDKAYVFSSGSLTYSSHSIVRVDMTASANNVEAKHFSATLRHPVWVAEPAIWTTWQHRGQMTSNDCCIYSCVDGILLALTANSNDPSSFQFMRTYGLLLLARIEAKDDAPGAKPATDLSLPSGDMEQIIARTERFVKASKERVELLSILR